MTSQEELCKNTNDLVFVIDESGSIVDSDPNNWDLMKQFAKMLTRQFAIGSQDRNVVCMPVFLHCLFILKFYRQKSVQNLLLFIPNLS